MLIRLILAGALALASLTHAAARDTGEFPDASPSVRQWFKSLHSPKGVPCCDTADGHRAIYRPTASGGLEVLIERKWWPVPPEAMILGVPNPTGEALVWYQYIGEELAHTYKIRCFILGTEG